MSTLTDLKIRALRGGKTRREIPDGNGLYLIVQESGAKSFALRYRLNGKPQKLTLGSYFAGDVATAPEPVEGGMLTLKGARKLAAEKLLERDRGVDPAAAKRESKIAARQTAEDTFEAIATKYVKREGYKLRTAHGRWLTLERQIFPHIGARPITEIKKSDIVRLLDYIEDNNGPVAAHRALSLISRIMNWHATRADDYIPPIVRGMARTKQHERARDRVLTDDELRIIWKVAGATEGPFGALIKFLLLTGARRDEAAKAPWSEIEGGDWVLPKQRNKINKELVRPLSQAARDLLDARPRIGGCEFVFSWDGRRPIAGYGKPKKRLDDAVLAELRKGDPNAAPFPEWRIHDLRRTARSLLARAGVSSEHAERCLGHVIKGVEGVYNRHQYREEMARAYEKLAALIERIVNPPPENVVPLSRRTQ